MTVFDAIAIGAAVKAGEARLFGKVIYHRQADNVTIRWEPLNGQTPAVLLEHRRDTLYRALQRRMAAMEDLPDRELSSKEIDRLNEDYGRCRHLLQVYATELKNEYRADGAAQAPAAGLQHTSDCGQQPVSTKGV